MCLSLLSFLRSNDNHTCHRARTIDRSGWTVLQNLETLDVIGIKTSYRRRDKRLWITRCQVVCTDIGCVFHDDTIDNPKWLTATIDRGSTTNANLWWRTEGSADILHRHTRCLTFKRTADICHTTQASLLSINLVRSTRKETAVGAGKTRHNNLVQCLSAWLEHHLHVGSTLQCLRRHTNVAHSNLRISDVSGKRELTINIGHCTRLGAHNHNGSTDNRLVIVGRHYGTRNFSLCQCRAYAHKQHGKTHK